MKTPQVPAMAGMTPLEFRERIKAICGLKPEGYYNPPVEPSTCVRTPKAAWIETPTECVLVGQVEGLR
jgi:hypothetical protein